MKKQQTYLKRAMILLAIIIVACICFIGIFKMDKGRMVNLVPDYLLGMDLKGNRTVMLNSDTSTKEVIRNQEGNVVESATEEEITQNGYTKQEEPVNREDAFTQENYEKAKAILTSRLKDLKFEDYVIKQNMGNGNMSIDLKEGKKTDNVLGMLTSAGKFELINNDTQEVLMNNNDITSAKVEYTSTNSSSTPYLNIHFTKEGKQKFKDITTNYTKQSDEEGNDTSKQVTLKIDGSTIMTTAFDQVVSNGILQLSIGNRLSSEKELLEAVEQAKTMAAVLNNDPMPITYKAEGNKYLQSATTKDTLKTVQIAIAVVIVLMLVYLIIKYKAKGILGIFGYIGFASIFLLILRYFNVEITTEGIFGIALSFLFNYALTIILLNFLGKEKNDRMAMKDAITKFLFVMIPIYIITIVFCFISYSPIYSFGMTMFWGITTALLYNILVTRNLLIH